MPKVIEILSSVWGGGDLVICCGVIWGTELILDPLHADSSGLAWPEITIILFFFNLAYVSNDLLHLKVNIFHTF